MAFYAEFYKSNNPFLPPFGMIRIFKMTLIGILDETTILNVQKTTHCMGKFFAKSQEATDTFDPHGKLLGSNYIFPNPSIMWSPKIPIKGLA